MLNVMCQRPGQGETADVLNGGAPFSFKPSLFIEWFHGTTFYFQGHIDIHSKLIEYFRKVKIENAHIGTKSNLHPHTSIPFSESPKDSLTSMETTTVLQLAKQKASKSMQKSLF